MTACTPSTIILGALKRTSSAHCLYSCLGGLLTDRELRLLRWKAYSMGKRLRKTARKLAVRDDGRLVWVAPKDAPSASAETNKETETVDKEPFYLSVRFWTAVLTPVVAALLPLAIERIPFLADLRPENVTAVVAAWVVAAVAYILARTVRNTSRSK